MPAPDAVIAAADARVADTLEQLEALTRIPSVSATGFDPAEVVRCAEAVAELLRELGLERVELLRVGDAHPYVVGEWLGAGPNAPTALLYAHHDVQPPGRESHWESPPFQPTRRDDGRIYGRGIVDDKAGILVFLAAIRAWFEGGESGEGPPINLKVIIEGEEEIGSTHLEQFLEAHRERLACDVMVLSDTANLEAGLPSITTSLRGLVNVDVHVRALDHPLHSGMWGGSVPDAASALTVLLGRLFDDDGRINVPGLESDVPPLGETDRSELAALPYDEAAFRADSGVVGSAAVGDGVWERLWRRPSLAVTGLEGRPLAEAANQLMDVASARVGLRLAPGQDADRALARLTAFLESSPPFGVEVTTESDTAVPGWATTPEGPAFDAARRALALGFGREPVCIGCGGSIPFVGPFASVLGGVPALLLGLEDPICNAHGENESLNVDDFINAVFSATHLFAELADIPRIRS